MWLLPLHCHHPRAAVILHLRISRPVSIPTFAKHRLHIFTWILSCFSCLISSYFKLATQCHLLHNTTHFPCFYSLSHLYHPLLHYSRPNPQLTSPVVWKITPLFATWLSSSRNPLTTLLTPTTTILELGAGVSAIVALALAPLVARYTATDQDYVLKLLRSNVAENLHTVFPKTRGKKPLGDGLDRISVEALDWEKDDVRDRRAVDVIVACDCIYNESLIEPLNSTCATLCGLRKRDETPTVCLVAQQLRSPDVFEAWLKSFHDKFEVWQVPSEMLGEGLKEGSGFVVHVGIVR